MLVRWDDSLSVNVDTIDNQHKDFIKAVNDMQIACQTPNLAKSEVEKVFKFLENYSIYHFIDEEKLMHVKRYPALTEHKIEHEYFKKSVSQLKFHLLEKGADEGFIAQINIAVISWLLNHIKMHDKLLGIYINKQR